MTHVDKSMSDSKSDVFVFAPILKTLRYNQRHNDSKDNFADMPASEHIFFRYHTDKSIHKHINPTQTNVLAIQTKPNNIKSSFQPRYPRHFKHKTSKHCFPSHT